MNIKLTASHDIDFSTGNLMLIEGDDEIAQKINVRLKFFRGEWFLDTRLGIPYFSDIIGKGRDLSAISAVMQRAILRCPGVAALSDFTAAVDSETRELSVSFSVTTIGGNVLDFSEVFIL